MSIRLVLADDHPLIVEALASLFCAEEDFEVVAACTDSAQALQAVRLHRPDILVLDLHMPGKNGLDVLREIAGERLPTRTVLLTAKIEDEEMIEAMRLGVGGVVLKEMARASPGSRSRSPARHMTDSLRGRASPHFCGHSSGCFAVVHGGTWQPRSGITVPGYVVWVMYSLSASRRPVLFARTRQFTKSVPCGTGWGGRSRSRGDAPTVYLPLHKKSLGEAQACSPGSERRRSADPG
jgi:CheY-like chemotaxis protein